MKHWGQLEVNIDIWVLDRIFRSGREGAFTAVVFFLKLLAAGVVPLANHHLVRLSRPPSRVLDPWPVAAVDQPVCHIASSTPSRASGPASWRQVSRTLWMLLTGGLQARRWRSTRLRRSGMALSCNLPC